MSESNKRQVGQRIKAALKKSGKTQAWLAEEVGIQTSYLSELINGHPRKRWNLDLLNAVSIALNVPLSEITGDSDETISSQARDYDAWRQGLSEKKQEQWDAMIEMQKELFGDEK